MKKTTKEDNWLRPDKKQPKNEIMCTHCKAFIGYTNESISSIRIDTRRDIRCKNCGKTAVKLFPTGYPAST